METYVNSGQDGDDGNSVAWVKAQLDEANKRDGDLTKELCELKETSREMEVKWERKLNAIRQAIRHKERDWEQKEQIILQKQEMQEQRWIFSEHQLKMDHLSRVQALEARMRNLEAEIKELDHELREL